jgi:hypothetical protein
MTDLPRATQECLVVAQRGLQYKYVQFGARGWAPLLFDIQADPDELRDLAGDPAMAPVLLECATEMLQWRLQVRNRRQVGPEVGPTSALHSCIPTGMPGPTCISFGPT